MAPGVVHVEGEPGGKAALEAQGQAVVIGSAVGLVLRNDVEARVGPCGWQVREAGRTRGCRTVRVQPGVLEWNVDTVRAHVIRAEEHVRTQGLLDFEVPLV